VGSFFALRAKKEPTKRQNPLARASGLRSRSRGLQPGGGTKGESIMIHADRTGKANAEARIDALLGELTVPEKVSLLAGSSMWLSTPVERLGIPAIKVSDGPNGARGGGSFAGGSVSSACFPVGIALAASWNTALVEQIGQA